MDYLIELKEERYKARQSTFLHLLTGFALCGTGAATFLLSDVDWIKTVFHSSILPAYIPGSIGIVYGLIVLFFVFSRNKWLQTVPVNSRLRITHVLIGFLLAVIFLLSHWWFAAGITGMIVAANLFAYLIEKKLAQPVFVRFTEQLIQLPATSRRKQLEWTEVERVILRHGNITIDCTNNFLYQWTIKHNDLDTALFERFCAAMIDQNRDKRPAEDW